MENQLNSTTFIVTVKTTKVKNARFSVTSFITFGPDYVAYLRHTLSKKTYWDCSGYKLMIVAIHESFISPHGIYISPDNPLIFH